MNQIRLTIFTLVSSRKQDMKLFISLLITLAVADSFPLENEENTAPETEILGPRVQDTDDLRMQPKIPMIETPLNDPAQQKDWDSNVDWSPRGVNVGGRKENGKRGWGISGNIGSSGGKPSWNVGVDYQHRFNKRGWANNIDADGLNAETPLTDPAQQSDWDGNVDWSPRGVNIGGRNENSKRGWGISGSYGRNNGKSNWGVGGNYKYGKRGWPNNFGGGRLTTVPDGNFFGGKNRLPYPYYYKN